MRLTFKIISVSDLPLPGDLFKCEFTDRFRSLVAEAGERDGATMFFDQLTAADRRRCRHYHAPDWAAVAAEAVEIIERLGTSPDPDVLDAAIQGSKLRKHEKFELSGLLRAFPMNIMRDGRYRDGQHRGCALRFSGAQRTVIEIYPEDLDAPD